MLFLIMQTFKKSISLHILYLDLEHIFGPIETNYSNGFGEQYVMIFLFPFLLTVQGIILPHITILNRWISEYFIYYRFLCHPLVSLFPPNLIYCQ